MPVPDNCIRSDGHPESPRLRGVRDLLVIPGGPCAETRYFRVFRSFSR
jgi:hypothetical protein